jgi:hypothetical protein
MFEEIETMIDSSETCSNAAEQRQETARERVERLFRTKPQVCVKPSTGKDYAIGADQKPESAGRD